ncbi:MAG: hypothetical protein IKX08_03660 [Lachnospiraceae bacterium]|nr:hypothetical protein [Lachnospiraceae bacterium]
MWKIVISILIGAVCGLLFDPLYKFAKKKLTKTVHAIRIWKLDSYLEKVKYDEEHQIISFYHVLENYSESAGRFILAAPGEKKFHFPFKSNYLSENMIDNTRWTNKKNPEYLDARNYPKVAAEVINMTGDDFVVAHKNSVDSVENNLKNKIKDGKPFFNGEMYGINELSLDKNGNVVIDSYISDYYTHRVMADIYMEKFADDGSGIVPKIRDNKGRRLKIKERLTELSRYHYYLSSMGMDILLYLEDEDVILMLKRSKNLFCMQENDMWHMSVNEAVSITDLEDGSGTTISLTKCVVRGIKEELGLSIEPYNPKIVFGDLFLLKRPIEAGITAFIRVKGVSFDMIKICYNAAKDGEFETSSIMCIPCNYFDIKKFIKKAKKNEELTAAGEYLLNMFLARSNKELFEE